MRTVALTCLLSLVAAVSWSAEKAKPIKALMVTGGCCHDYTRQKTILAEGLAARANIEWTIVQEGGSSLNHKFSVFQDKEWTKKYDIVVHNECFADVKDLDFIHGITEGHKAGVPSVVIHCAMHCYRGKTDEWFKCCGVRSHNHGAQIEIKAEATKPDHPIMTGVPKNWTVPPTEMYNIAEVYEPTTVLATGVQKDSKPNALIWVSQYGKARVFGTTLGHHNKEMEEAQFLDIVSRGLLWACGKLGDDGKPLPGYEGTGVKPQPKSDGPQPTPAK